MGQSGRSSLYAVKLYESPTVPAAVPPSSAATGAYTVTVNYNRQATKPSPPVHVVPIAFGLFNIASASGTADLGYGPGEVEQIGL